MRFFWMFGLVAIIIAYCDVFERAGDPWAAKSLFYKVLLAFWLALPYIFRNLDKRSEPPQRSVSSAERQRWERRDVLLRVLRPSLLFAAIFCLLLLDTQVVAEVAYRRLSSTPESYSSFVKDYSRSWRVPSANLGRERSLWRQATVNGSVDDIFGYLKEYPNGQYACTASLKLIDRLRQHVIFQSALRTCAPSSAEYPGVRAKHSEFTRQDEALYRKTLGSAHLETLRAYTEAFPDGLHRDEVLVRMEQIANREALRELVAKAFSLPRAEPPREGVELIVVDKGQHGDLVARIADASANETEPGWNAPFSLPSAEAGPKKIPVLRLDIPFYQALAAIVRRKLLRPQRLIVVNMSFVLPQDDGIAFVDTLLQKLRSAGILVVAAAGNDGGPLRYPAKYRSVIGVGAVDQYDRLKNYSNRGPELQYCARDQLSLLADTIAHETDYYNTRCDGELRALEMIWHMEGIRLRLIQDYLAETIAGVGARQGTSFTAPVVAGRAAAWLYLWGEVAKVGVQAPRELLGSREVLEQLGLSPDQTLDQALAHGLNMNTSTSTDNACLVVPTPQAITEPSFWNSASQSYFFTSCVDLRQFFVTRMKQR